MKLEKLNFQKNGLIPIIVQNINDGQVLMFAYGNKETIKLSIETKNAHYWSRSRNKVWMKGEESGNIQELIEIYYDCDEDVLLYLVKQNGVACHTENMSCFYRNITDKHSLAPIFQNKEEGIINRVYKVIEERKNNPSKDSYVSSLFDKGIDKIIKKIGEEAGEVIIGAKNKDNDEIVYEITDLWFHSLIALSYFDISPDEIYREFEKRFGKKKQEYGRD